MTSSQFEPLTSGRVFGAKRTLLRAADRARNASLAEPDADSQAAASLRGKAVAYRQGADIIAALIAGTALPKLDGGKS